MRANRQNSKESTKMKYHRHTVLDLDELKELEIFERDLSRVTEYHYM